MYLQERQEKLMVQGYAHGHTTVIDTRYHGPILEVLRFPNFHAVEKDKSHSSYNLVS